MSINAAMLNARKRCSAVVFVIALAIALSGLAISSAVAEPIPPEYLQADYENCVAGDKSKWMKQYCTCFVDEIERTMDLKEYLDVTAEIMDHMAKGGSELDVLTTNKTFANAVDFCLRKAG